MPITEEQRLARKEALGSSDMAAILGLDPWRNAYDVWLEKTGQVEDNKETEVMQAGSLFEDGVLNWAEMHLGKLERNVEKRAQGFPIVSHIDAVVISPQEPVEAKTAGLFGPVQEDYGENGTDELPDRVIIQSHVHMLCIEKDICHVPAFIGGRGFNMFRVNRDEVIINSIMDASLDFWEKYVIPNEPPPNVIPSIEIVKRIRRIPEKIVELDPKLVQEWLDAKDKVKWAEEIKKDAQAAMLAAIGDAEGANCGSLGLLTYFQQSSSRIDVDKLKEEQPEIAKQYTKVSTCRVPRLKKLKPTKWE